MKVKAINLMPVVLFATLITLANWRVVWSATPFHNQSDCTVCHDFEAFDCGTYVNIKAIKCTINSRSVDFRVIPGDYANADDDGVCQACHRTSHVTTDKVGTDCTTCHGSHCPNTPNPGDIGHFMTPGGAPVNAGHITHIEANPKMQPMVCDDCHGGGSYVFSEIVASEICNICHSPDGAFDGMSDAQVGAGILANWTDGIYEADGITLKPGKDEWCATCHDDLPANSEKDGSGINAPNVIGDNTTYGFYVTGHKESCITCHDASKTHIDGNPRTYEVNETPDPDVVINPYCDSYRLKDIGGQPSMNIPRPIYPAGTNPLTYWQDFALCFDCHNRYEVVGSNKFAISNTNFKTGLNAHYRHIGEFNSNHFDSDWDGVADSTETCITCHNVHGSPTKAMTRYGELISTYGTTDKVPALNFAYLVQPTGVTATWQFPGPNGSYYVYARWTADPSRASNAKYTINYDTGTDTIYKSQKTNGGTWNQLGISSYSFVGGNSVVLSSDGADGWIVADAIGWDTDGVLDPNPEIIVDNTSASYQPSDWPSSSWTSGYWGTNYQYYAIPSRDPDATVVESLGGNMAWNGKTIVKNGVCNSCHSQSGVSYLRTPFLGPKVLDPDADPDSVPADGLTTVTLTCTVLDHNDNVTGVTINLLPIGGGTENMVDQGGGLYSYQTTVPESTSPGVKSLLVTATDLDGTGTNYITLTVTGAPGMPIIIDNVDGTPTGTWYTSSWAPGYYGDNYHYHTPGSGTDTFRWTIPTIDTPGTYEVFARWTSDPSRAPNATYTIYHDGAGSPTAVPKDQRYNGGEWVSLGTFDLDGAGDYVELSENPSGYVVADAIMIAPPTVTIIVDNPDGSFTGTWGTSTWAPGYYGANYHYHVPGSGGDTFTWTPTITTAGTYEVFARWTSDPSRAPNATYTIYHDGAGSPTAVPKDQRSNGGKWVSLGTFDFDGVGVEKVELTENSSGYVVADAIMWELQ